MVVISTGDVESATIYGNIDNIDGVTCDGGVDYTNDDDRFVIIFSIS